MCSTIPTPQNLFICESSHLSFMHTDYNIMFSSSHFNFIRQSSPYTYIMPTHYAWSRFKGHNNGVEKKVSLLVRCPHSRVETHATAGWEAVSCLEKCLDVSYVSYTYAWSHFDEFFLNGVEKKVSLLVRCPHSRVETHATAGWEAVSCLEKCLDVSLQRAPLQTIYYRYVCMCIVLMNQ